MMQIQESIDRRRFLRGVGIALSLPVLESLLPRTAQAATSRSTVATTATGMPLRSAFIYHPNGVNQKLWHPTGQGRDFELGKTHEPIAAFKDKLQIISNLDQLNALAGEDGAGDHARAPGVWLTGLRIKKSDKDIRANISIDQVMASRIGKLTRIPSLELISDGSRRTGNCDSGYSCEYQYNVSWSSPTTPNPPEHNPRLVFERLFGAGTASDRRTNLAMRRQTRRSVLDFVREDARRLNGELGVKDRQKLGEYLESVREVERRIENVERLGHLPDPGVEAPAGMPGDFGDRIDVMLEMMALAFITDATRVSTLILARDLDDRVFRWLGISGGHHTISHYKSGDKKAGVTAEKNLAWLGEIDYWYMKRFAKFVRRLEEAKDADGTSVLDNSIIMYSGGISDSNSHSHNNLPTLLLGNGGGRLNTGRYVNAKPGRDPLTPPVNHSGDGTMPLEPGIPMCNFFLGLLDRLGVEGIDRFGDSTGRFSDF